MSENFNVEIPAVATFLEEAEEIIAAAISVLDENGARPFADARTYMNIAGALMFALTLDRAGLTEDDFARAIEAWDAGDHA